MRVEADQSAQNMTHLLNTKNMKSFDLNVDTNGFHFGTLYNIIPGRLRSY